MLAFCFALRSLSIEAQRGFLLRIRVAHPIPIVKKILDIRKFICHRTCMRLGELLQSWRKERGLTLKEMVPRIGIPLSTLSRIECGGMMDGPTLARILLWAMGK